MANTIDISSLQTFSDSELLTAYRYAIARGAFSRSYTVNGRMFEVPDAATCMKMVTWLEQRIQDDANLQSGEGGNVAVAIFDDPT